MNRQLTMLIVDDMEVERISFAEIFKDEYQILEAENGKQAMEQLEQQKVHIVLLDLCMPVMDGFEVIREMKQQDKYADIPIVAKTAIDEKTEVKALEAGADEYIFSPCDPAIVKKRVHNLVEKYILEREKIRVLHHYDASRSPSLVTPFPSIVILNGGKNAVRERRETG